ncbi:MAG: branched-chain amino acid aminotransferase [Caulobacterales bacterium]|nr:branched-chain amino acid aminotransferase [Caulobacterales bacterium]
MADFVPYDDRDGVIWWNGAFVEWRKANAHVLTHALHYGGCVFEGERAYGGAIFKSREHTERLLRSAELIGFQIPYTAEAIEAAKRETLARQGFDDAYIRAVAWRGSEQMGVSAQRNTIHLAIAVWQWGDYFADKTKGVRLDVSDWRRPPPDCAPVKSKAAGLYMICTLSKHAAEARGFADALMYDHDGRVAECTGAHIFFIKDGVLHTPTTEWVLEGITRATVIDLARARGVEVVERHILPEELSGFSECFIVGTAAEVTAVAEIKGIHYTPGEITRQLMSDYDALVRGGAQAHAAE